MTATNLIEKYIENFESLFEPHVEFKLKIDFCEVSSPVIRGKDSDMKILIPKMYEDVEFEDHAKELMLLFILAHETAHYINKLTHHKDTSVLDSRAIEIWADFFGCKLLLTVCFYCDFFINRYQMRTNLSVFFDNYYNGLNNMFDTYYNKEHKKYPSKHLRYQVGHTATTSFLTILDNGNLCSSKIILATSTFAKLKTTANVTDKEFRELISYIFNIKHIHKQILGGNTEITYGVKPEYKKYIGTDY